MVRTSSGGTLQALAATTGAASALPMASRRSGGRRDEMTARAKGGSSPMQVPPAAQRGWAALCRPSTICCITACAVLLLMSAGC